MLASQASAQSPAESLKVGIIAPLHVNLSDEEVDAIVETLASVLEGRYELQAFWGPPARRELAQKGRIAPAECLADPACLAGIGEALDADKVLALSLVRVGSRIRISMTWSDVGAGRAADPISVELQGDSDHREALEMASAQVVKGVAESSAAPDAGRVGQEAEELAYAQEPRGRAAERATTPAEAMDLRRPEIGSGRRMTTASWILSGAAGLAIVAGGATAVIARRKRASYLRDCEAGRCSATDYRSIKRGNFTADLLFASAAAAGLSAALLYFFSGDPPDSRPHLGVSDSGVHMSWQVAF